MSRSATLEVAWSRLVAAADEQAAALKRTSFTPVVRDSGDLSAAVFDARGRMMAQAVTGTPGHINSLAASMRHFLAAFPDPQPGDVLLTNEPWLSSGQLNDLTVVTPVHAGGRPIGFVGSTCHAVDIGGRGLSADAAEVFEEGLRIPPMRLHTAGSQNRELPALIEANVRTPELVLGDLHAQVVGNGVVYVVGALAITIGAVLVSRETAEVELERTAKPEEREIVERPEELELTAR